MLQAALPEAEAPPSVELSGTPFFPQTEYYCGPAALATVLGSAGVDVGLEELGSLVYLPEKRGSLQIEMITAARHFRRLPYRIEPGLEALLGELRAGRPVLVFQNLGIELIPVWHYAVVVGYDVDDDTVVLRSGTQRRRVMAAGDFMDTWERADNWAVVVLRPGELPADPDPGRYLEAVAAMEQRVPPALSLQWLRAAARRWPENALIQFALGNALYAQGRSDRSMAAYRRALSLQPGLAAARNNLAHLLAEQGCPRQALSEIERALSDAGGNAELLGTLEQTRSEIRARMESGSAASDACP